MAKEFRDWAEDYIIEGRAKPKTPAIPQTFSEALLLAAEQARQLELQAPKVKPSMPSWTPQAPTI